jgi:hypothetical protein
MADDRIEVQLGAQIGELRSGMAQAATAVTGAIDGMKTQLASLADAARSAQERLEAGFRGIEGAFTRLQGVFVALSSIAAGGRLFGDAIKETIEFNGQAIQLQRVLGLTAEEALNYNVALRLIGRSSDEFVGIVIRLERQLRLNEDRMKELGVVTRDAHGEYLKAPEIFANALHAVQQFKAGTDQNLASIELFGRGAQEMYSFFKLNEATMERARELIREYNIELENPEAIRNYKIEMAALGLVNEQLNEKLAHELLPTLQALAAFFSSEGPGAIRLVVTEIRGLMSVVVLLESLWGQLKVTTETTWDQIVEILRSAAAKAKAIATLHWGELERLSQEHETRMTAITAAGEEARVQIMLSAARQMEKLFGMGGEAKPAAAAPAMPGGTRSYTSPAAGGGAGRTPKAAADDRMSQWREQLQQQLIAERNFFSDSKAEELAFWQEKLKLTENGSKIRLQVETQIFQLEKALAQQGERDAIEAADSKARLADAVYARARAALEGQVQLGKMSAAEEVANERALLEAKWALDQKYFADKLAAAENDSRERQKLQQQEALAYQKFLTDEQALNIKAAEATKQAWQNALGPIKSALASAATGVAMGTQTLSQAAQHIGQSVAGEIISKLADKLFDKLGDLFTSILPDVLKSALGIGEQAASTAAITAAITGAGASTDAAIAASTTAIVGAIEEAAIVEAVTPKPFGFAHGGIVPSAARGWVVPSFADGGVLSALHQREMVLPAHISDFVQAAAANYAGGAAPGGGHTININVSAVDSQSVAKFFRANSASLVQAVNHGMRNGSMLRAA